MDDPHGRIIYRGCTQLKFTEIDAPPHTKLPNEILAEIFNLSTPKPVVIPGPVRDSEFPWVLLRICKRWRGIALGMPDLWDNIHVDYDGTGVMQLNVRGITRAAKGVLLKSKDIPITLEVSSTAATESIIWPFMLEMMMPHFHRLKSLTLDISGQLLENFFRLEPIQFDCLEHVSLASDDMQWTCPATSVFRDAHQLRRITIEMPFDWRINPLPWSQLTHITMFHWYSPHAVRYLLRLCPAVVVLYIKIGKLNETSTGQPNPAPIRLPCLTTLSFNAKDITEFLRPLVLPCLNHLELLCSRSSYTPPVWNTAITPLLCTFHKLETLITRIFIPANDIQSLLEGLVSLVKLKILESEGLLQSTLTSLGDGFLATRLELLQCTINPHSLESHLLMLERREDTPHGAAPIRGIFRWDFQRGLKEKRTVIKQQEQLITKLQGNGHLDIDLFTRHGEYIQNPDLHPT